MSAVLERIEQLLPGTAGGPAKTLMVAIYTLWHRLAAPDRHRPSAERILGEHDHLLQRSEVPSFVVGLFLGSIHAWTADEWYALATGRREQRSKRRHLELPPGVDAALHAMASEQLLTTGRIEDARTLARYAVEEMPGNEQLIAWEAALVEGRERELDVNTLVFGVTPDAAQQDESNAEEQQAAESQVDETAEEGREDRPGQAALAVEPGRGGGDDTPVEPGAPLDRHV